MKLLSLFLPLLVWSTIAFAQPSVRFTVPDHARAADSTNFTSNCKRAVRYEWNFGDGKTSTEANPSHRYLASGEYKVRLRAFDEKGKSREKSKTIKVESPERCLVHVETPMGDMLIQLYDDTPLHQDNFTKLLEENYYDSLLFHRVINGFMIQGGDPNSRNAAANARLGSGGPGYTVPAEFQDSLAHVKGALAAARTNNPQKRSSGSQFYIVQGRSITDADLDRIEAMRSFRYPKSIREAYLQHGGTPQLDQEYTVFGMVIDGLDVIDKIATVPTLPGDRPKEDVWMKIKLVR